MYTGGSPPPRSLQTWVTCCGLGHTPDESTALIPHDIYALGTQENPQGEREWTEHIKATLRSYTHTDFKQVILLFLKLFSLIIFIHKATASILHLKVFLKVLGSITAYVKWLYKAFCGSSDIHNLILRFYLFIYFLN